MILALVLSSSLRLVQDVEPERPPLHPDLRLELGARLLEFERRLKAARPEENELRAFDAAFDRATLEFFGGNSHSALGALDECIAGLPALDPPAADCLATWRDLDEGSLAEERDALAARLESAIEKMPDLVDVAGIAFARLDKLRARDPGDTLRLVEPFDRFREEVAAEVAAICRGVDPYRGRSGNRWQAITTKQVWRFADLANDVVPYRIVIPTDRRPDERFPLVIAFHGAGGDENMFAFAYGAGELARLAEEKRFVLITPLTYPFLRRTELFSRLKTRAEYLAPIDDSRLYTLGHSMGCGPASVIAVATHRGVAATALFAGSGSVAAASPPTIVVFGKNDLVVPFRTAERRLSKIEGARISIRAIEDRGHTLLVGEHLADAVDFLLSHSLPEPTSK